MARKILIPNEIMRELMARPQRDDETIPNEIMREFMRTPERDDLIIPDEIIRELMHRPQRDDVIFPIEVMRELIPRPQRDDAENDPQPGPSRRNVSRKRRSSLSPLGISSAKKRKSIQSLDSSSSESLSSLSDCQSGYSPGERSPKRLKKCCICSKICHGNTYAQCPCCRVRVHKECLYAHQPLWNYKLSLCPWICKQCRLVNCYKCLTKTRNMASLRRCHSCKVGMDAKCYDKFKPTHLLAFHNNIFLCFSCMAFEMDTKQLDELHYVGSFSDPPSSESSFSSSISSRSSSSSCSSRSTGFPSLNGSSRSSGLSEISNSSVTIASVNYSCSSFSGTENGSSSRERTDYFSSSSTLTQDEISSVSSSQSDSSQSSYYRVFYPVKEVVVMDVSGWNSQHLRSYLISALPGNILAQIIKKKVNGRILLIMRKSIVSPRVKVALGPLLKVFKEFRIGQHRARAYGYVNL